MKILLIAPGIDNEYGKDLKEGNKYRFLTPLLALPYLAAVTPPGIEVKIIDEENGLMTEYEEADLVGISGMTMHANRMYKLADHYRGKGIPVVLGGIHVTHMSREASLHADAVVIGEAEEIWPQLLNDFQAGKLKPIYKCGEYISLENLPFPRVDLAAGPTYSPPSGYLNSIMATRGCPHNCSFCCVTKTFGRNFRTRPIEKVIAEVQSMAMGPVFFNDDNLIGNQKYAKELFQALIPLKIKWGSQVSIKIAENPELLDLAKESGCTVLFIGIETVNPDNIVSINKKMVNTVEKYSDSLKKIHDHGIRILGSFIVGLDNDDETVFDQVYDFIEQNKIDTPLVGILTPFPGTDLWKQFEAEGRIIDRNWEKYNFFHVVFQPKKMTPEQLQFGYHHLVKRLLRNETKKYKERYLKSGEIPFSM
jgi:radical SAM superfamily enzyme YgiQ (UPF0313 family)